MKDIEKLINSAQDDDEDFINCLRELFDGKNGEYIEITNPDRLLQVKMSLDSFKQTFSDQKVSISCKLNEPSVSMGVIYANGNSLIIKNKTQFLRACKLASNVDIYPKTDGTVMIALTFRGLATRVK